MPSNPSSEPLNTKQDSIVLESDNDRWIARWRGLFYINLYRLVLALLLVMLGLYTSSDLAQTPDWTYRIGSISYLLIAIGFFASTLSRYPAFSTQVYSEIITDIVAVTFLMHNSGGISSGLGMLMIVAIASGSLLQPGRTAYFFAATATLSILLQQIYSTLSETGIQTSYTHAGLLGISFFATAFLAHTLAQRLQATEALAEQRGIDLANMSQLAEYIIQRMQTGIIVIDRHNQLRLTNESAKSLLNIEAGEHNQTAASLPAELGQQLQRWRHDPNCETQIIRSPVTAAEVLPRFASLGHHHDGDTLIFLEDRAATAQQAQQLKLASLGRLTASIAHEVRNPLGAISHASQLLAESDSLTKDDIRLTEIIETHSQRVNTIIENIMQLSRRDKTQPQDLDLSQWLRGFCQEFQNAEHLPKDSIKLIEPELAIHIRFDSSQLHQVLWNLCCNAHHHGKKNGIEKLTLHTGLAEPGAVPYLDVIDYGPGIPAEKIDHVFEPFFTTEVDGTGLGLYLARELCESNQARLNYIPPDAGQPFGACFRINFADPRRKQVI